MFDPCFQHWKLVRWENTQTHRYYEARVVKNLFEEWEILCLWGAIGTRLGGSAVIPVTSLDEAQKTLAKIAARRTQQFKPTPCGGL